MTSATEQLWWPAPAKLNLMLHITGRREDGYHQLETLFQLLDVGDELSFVVNDTGAINRLTDIAGVSAEQDLVVRAAHLLQAHAGVSAGADIDIRKRLPMGGGLGGGSSDAATTLVALNALWACGLPVDELAMLGLQLGADVPVFVKGESAFATGVGECLHPVSLPDCWYVVVTPNVHMSTAAVFSDHALKRNCFPVDLNELLEGFDLGAKKLAGINVCETIVVSQQKEVANLLSAMAEFAPARMTGTGSSIFGRFSTEQEAQSCGKYFEGLNQQVFVARAVNRSPLLATLENFRKTLS